jgi:hypothetical protein
VAGGWRGLHNEELHNFYASPHIIMMIISMGMRQTGHAARTGEITNTYKILVGKHEDKRPLERHEQIRG